MKPYTPTSAGMRCCGYRLIVPQLLRTAMEVKNGKIKKSRAYVTWFCVTCKKEKRQWLGDVDPGKAKEVSKDAKV